MSRFNIKDILTPTAALVIICGICTALLAGTNELTKEPIASAEEMSLNRSMQSVAADSGVKFEKTDIDDPAAECYKVLDKDGNIVSYAVSVKTKGYGGTIKVMTGIDTDGNIIGVNVYDNSDETPGLGAKTSDKSFEDQFTGKSAFTEFAVSKDSVKYPGDQTVDAVTGATISSRGVVGAVNHALGIYKNICGGES